MSVELAETGEGATPSNADLAYQIIRERLIMLDIRPSEPINDEGLARQLGFGRTPVREALKRLERDRLVIAYPRRGTFATTVDITDLAHIQEIRRQLEPVVAARAATQRPAGNPGKAVRTRRRDRQARPNRRPACPACGSTCGCTPRSTRHPATRIWRTCWCARTPTPPASGVCSSTGCRMSAEHITEHVALLRAIIDGDADLAAKLASEHVVGFEQAVRAVL